MCMPMAGFAQNSGWEVPQTAQKGLFDKKPKAEFKTKDGKVVNVDPKYLDGAVTLNSEGKVEWTITVKADGKSASQLYDLVYKYLEDRVKRIGIDKSRIALINKEKHVVASSMTSWITFKKAALALDQTKINYNLIATCQDGSVELKLNGIGFNYEEGRDTAFKVSAEDWITDENGLNKKHTNLSRMSGKFRKGTIDFKDELFAGFEQFINNN